jgi:alanyl-tRNA synthetase
MGAVDTEAEVMVVSEAVDMEVDLVEAVVDTVGVATEVMEEVAMEAGMAVSEEAGMEVVLVATEEAKAVVLEEAADLEEAVDLEAVEDSEEVTVVMEDMANMAKQKYLNMKKWLSNKFRNQEVHSLQISYKEIPFGSVTVFWNLYNRSNTWTC